MKFLYYYRSVKISQANNAAKRIERQVIKEIDLTALAQDDNVCIACEG